MSILIKGMEMPKNCEECPLSLYQHSPCWKNGGVMDWENRPNWCPLISIPPHGRLIDRDALTLFGQIATRDAPTIIEAEVEE